jgi:predicted Rossmann-fold nucleotide-binding protein
VGRLVAERGAVVVCGGLGGAMESACRGAKQAGGLTEIALALRAGKRVVGLDTWDVEGVAPADGPEAAVSAALS